MTKITKTMALANLSVYGDTKSLSSSNFFHIAVTLKVKTWLYYNLSETISSVAGYLAVVGNEAGRVLVWWGPWWCTRSQIGLCRVLPAVAPPGSQCTSNSVSSDGWGTPPSLITEFFSVYNCMHLLHSDGRGVSRSRIC